MMWENFATAKAKSYLGYKFLPTHRIGLTNFLREQQIYIFLDPQKEDVLLDAGCASGRQLFALAGKIKAGYGTDIAQAFIEQANKFKAENKIENLTFLQSDLEKLPFEDNFFDKIVCAEVLEHVFDFDLALLELKRVLKSQATLVITVPNLNADATIWGRFLRLLKIRQFKPITNFSSESLALHGDAHVREFTAKVAAEKLGAQGFDVKLIRTASFIDGPGIDLIMKFLLKVPFLRSLIIKSENILTNRGWLLGRHLIIKAQKK